MGDFAASKLETQLFFIISAFPLPSNRYKYDGNCRVINSSLETKKFCKVKARGSPGCHYDYSDPFILLFLIPTFAVIRFIISLVLGVICCWSVVVILLATYRRAKKLAGLRCWFLCCVSMNRALREIEDIFKLSESVHANTASNG